MSTALLADMGRGFGHGHDGYMFGILFWVLTVAAIVAVIVWAVRSRKADAPANATSPPVASSPTANAEAILAERLARGEVAPDDYRVLLATLRGAASSGAADNDQA